MSEVGAGIDPQTTAEIPTPAGADYAAEQPLGSPSAALPPLDGADGALADRDPSEAAAPYQQHDDEDQPTSRLDEEGLPHGDGLYEDRPAEERFEDGDGAPPAAEDFEEDARPADEGFEEDNEDARRFGPTLDEILPDEAGADDDLPEEANARYGEAGTTQLIFVDVLIVLPSSNPVVILQEADAPYRELRIPIGGPEGIAIGYAARRIATPRPLTHELMSLILKDFDLTLEVVRITGCSGGSFTAEIVLSGPSGARTIDCRPSDAIALALRQRLPVPIVATADVIEQAGSGAAGSN